MKDKFLIIKEKIDFYFDIALPINKLTKTIYRVNKGCVPALTKDDCRKIAMCILWNDADGMKEVLSYTNENGDRIFPRTV